MTRDEFDALIKRLEATAQQNPQRYVWRVGGLLALAYGYLALVLLGSLVVLFGTIALVIAVHSAAFVKLALILIIAAGGIAWAVIRGLWVRLEPPEGFAITREQAPQLFALLDELRTALDCAPFHSVLIIPDYNAAVVQVPRLGILGWHRNYLLLGLPLMQSLGPDEFKAVLAHEFAHSSRGHGRFGNWLYRVRRSWERIFEQMARQGTRGGAILWKFLNWFWPIFNAHAFVLARANEYEADACSVRLAGADAAAGALLRLPVGGTLISEKFWPDVYGLANEQAQPPAQVMSRLGDALKTGLPVEASAKSLRTAFLLETNNGDTHPCLKDRLRAIGQLPAGVERGEFPPTPPPAPTQSASEVFLGAQVEVVALGLSEEWQKAVSPQWAERHSHARKLSEELAALNQPTAGPPPLPEALWKKATKLIELHDDTAALPVIEQLLAVDPKHAPANFIRGRHDLKQDDPCGVEFIEKAIAADPSLTEAGCDLLYGHFTRTGQRDKLRSLEERMDQFRELSALAQQERSDVSIHDDFFAHGLEAEAILKLKTVFEVEKEIASAALVRKRLRHLPAEQFYVIALRLKIPSWKLRSSDASQKLVNRILEHMELPGPCMLFVEEQNMKAVGKKVFSVPDAVIYERRART